MDQELKPCRNCGGKCDPKGWMRGDGLQGPECEVCGITTPDVESWNRVMGEQDASQGGEAVAPVVWRAGVNGEWVYGSREYVQRERDEFEADEKDDPDFQHEEAEPLMTVAQHQRIMAASLGSAEPVAWRVTGRDGLTVTAQYPEWAEADCLLTIKPLYTHPADQVAEADAELVSLITEIRKRCQLPDWARIRIDALLAKP